MPQLDEAFWQEEYARILNLIVSIWLETAWAAALAVMAVMNEAGMPAVDEAVVYANILDWIGANAPQEAALILQTTKEAVDKAIEQAGDDKELLALLLEPIFGPERAETIGLTEAIIGTTIGNLLAWQSYGIIDEVIWMTAEDERVCPICRPRHEEVIKLSDATGGYRPPAHPRCRCWLEAILILVKHKTLADALFAGIIEMEQLEAIAYVIEV
jgi:SPP1 gp7 family putative phage head morphogenesis protein